MQLMTGVALAVTLAVAQNVADVRQLYDEGRYQEMVQAAGPGSAPRVQYLAAQGYAKLNDADSARRTYQRLADGGAGPWAAIGRSGVQLIEKQLDEALASANQAVAAGDAVPEAHFQRGLVLMTRQAYGDAASAFTRATELDPMFAAAYYYAGLANYRVKRVDLMTNNFSTFVKLAPKAPERPEVESILRTVRGR